MRGHNICFHSEIRKIILTFSSIPCLIWSSVVFCTECTFVNDITCIYFPMRYFIVFLHNSKLFSFTGCAEQGQLGRVAECFAHRGGRKGLGRTISILSMS